MAVLSEFVEGSSSSSTNNHKYDVFLSFRGADTRQGFTAHLHKALQDANISTFFDDEEIETGGDLKPELESAIKASRASIIVLSKNYANSSWCLDELVLILEQRVRSNHIVIPIFFHVEPTHVRKQQSTFGDALAEHRKKMERETDPIKRNQLAQKIDRWIEALTEVANLRGENANGRRETDLIEEIVEDINRRLHTRVRSAPPLLIGINYSINFVTSWLNDASSDTGDILTILGIGGIGKTSLARYVYGLYFREFERSSYIEGISRICAQSYNGLRDLQKQLCDDISRSSTQVHDVSTYTSMIENAISRKKVLLVLDDVDSAYQLDALLGSRGLNPGSKIIITTRNASLTESCAVFRTNVKPKHANHELRGLRETESRQLFCNHAFMSNDPKAGYEELSEKFVMYCEGHPLALKVLGKSLHNKDVAYWEGQVEMLTKEIDSHVNNVLRMSFDSLPFKDDKDVFLDIACFFVGMDRDFTETILKDCNLNTSVAFWNLIDRCLLSIGHNNELVMHRLVQEMGRSIVRQESSEKPCKRSRVWCHDDSLKVLKRKTGTENILGLTLDMRMLKNEKLGETFELETDALSKMDNLMLLKLNFVKINGSYRDFPKELRSLCMHGFPLKSIPSDLQMENLVALDMSYSNIESIGVCYNSPQHPHVRQKLTQSCSQDRRLLGSLKILNLSFCLRLRSLCGISGFPALERLIVRNCISLVEVCESIEKCVELVLIDLSYCSNLQKGPNIGNLKNVKRLLLDGCDLGEPRISIRNTDSPEMLKANNIDIDTTSSSAVMKAMPSDSKFLKISLPRSLVRLSLANNNLSNKSFPMDFSGLSMLNELCLDENPIVSLPNCVRSLPRLEKLSMKECKMLISVEHPPHTLTHLDLSLVDGYSRPSLEYVVFDPEMSPLRLSLEWKSGSSLEIQGMVKVQPMADVEEKLLCSLGWTKLDLLNQRHMKIASMFRELEGSEIQMYYEFGIFSTFYGGEEIPNWVIYRCKGRSISFTIPSMPNSVMQLTSYKLRGLNFCFVLSSSYQFRNSDLYGVRLPMIEIINITKKLTWMYHHYVYKVSVGGECITLLSHWMFGKNEMEGGDHVTITLRGLSDDVTKECGVSFVYDDGKTDGEDALSYYKSWNHIIGGDLTGFQTTTGEYLLRASRFWYYESDLETYGFDGVTSYKEAGVSFRALSQRKSNVREEEDNGVVKEGKKKWKGRRQWGAITLESGKEMEFGLGKGHKNGKDKGISTIEIEKGRSDCPNEIIFTVGSVKIDPPAVTSDVSEAWNEHIEDATRNMRDTEDDDHSKTKYDDLDEASSLHRSNEKKFGSGNVGFFNANKKLHVNSKGKCTDLNSGLEGLDRKSKRKNKLWKTCEDVIHELDQQHSEEEYGNLSSRKRHRCGLMDMENILEFPAYAGNEAARDGGGCLENSFVNPPDDSCPEDIPVVSVDKGKAFDATEGMSESKEQHSWGGTATGSTLADYGHADFYRLLRIKAAEQAALMAEAANRGDCLAAIELKCVQMQAGYEESQNKMKAVEAEHSVLVDRLSHAEVARVKAESELEHSEALRADANQKVLALEASKELLESEKKHLEERVAMLEAADAERVGQLEVAREGVTVCGADLEWVLREGIPCCFDKVLESEAFLRAYKRLQKSCIEYGREHGCRMMRDKFQLEVPDAELPGYKQDRVRDLNEACSSFAEMDYVAEAGLAELSVDALRAFCLSSDEESN